MSRFERDKGARGEREVATVFRAYGLPVERTPNSGGLHVAGDLTGLDGFHIEVKRQETLRLPLWMKQAHDEAGADDVPVVAFRQSRGEWYAAVPLQALAALIATSRRGAPITEPPGRCPYCGEQTSGGPCAAHSDLPKLDPYHAGNGAARTGVAP